MGRPLSDLWMGDSVPVQGYREFAPELLQLLTPEFRFPASFPAAACTRRPDSFARPRPPL